MRGGQIDSLDAQAYYPHAPQTDGSRRINVRRLVVIAALVTVLVASFGFAGGAASAQAVCPGDLDVPPIASGHIKTHADPHVPACN
jgi:hypothetical protein